MLNFLAYFFVSLFILLDCLTIYIISKKFLIKADRGEGKDTAVASILGAVSIWCLRSITLYYAFLIPWNSSVASVVVYLIFLVPEFLLILHFRKFFNSGPRTVIASLNRFWFLVLSFLLLGTLFQSAGETTWDGSTYHLPIELMVKESGSLWNWPDLIYSQWQLSGIETTFAAYNFVFQSDRAALLVSFIAFLTLLILFLKYFPKYKIVVALIFLSIPPLLQQVSSRYIDMIIAVASVSAILIVQLKEVDNHFRVRPFILSIPILAYAFSGKWTAVVSEVLAFTIVALYSYYFLKSRKVFLSNLAVIAFSFGLGLFPVAFRNMISFQNPLFPYQFGPFNSGYFSLKSYSADLGNLYASQVNWTGYSLLEQGLRQYFVSPFQSIYLFISRIPEFLKLDFANTINDPFFYRTFVYDNRLGGFGPIILFSVIILLLKCGLNVLEKLVFVLSLGAFLFLPSFIHSRYYLTIGIVYLWIALDLCSRKKIIFNFRRPIAVLMTSLLIVFSGSNVASLAYRLFPNGIANYPIDQSTASLSTKINPDCSEIFHVGSGLWGVDAVWGPNLCGSVFAGININGFLFNSKIGNTELEERDLNRISKFIYNSESEKKRIVCSFPKNGPNPCIKIKTYIEGEEGISYTSSGEVSEGPTGPTLESLYISTSKKVNR